MLCPAGKPPMEPPSYAYGPPPTFYQHGFYQPMCPVYAPQPQRTIIVEPRRVVERVVPVIRRKEDWGYPPGCSDDEVEEYYSEGQFNSDGSSSDSDSEDDRKKRKVRRRGRNRKTGEEGKKARRRNRQRRRRRRKKEELDDPYFAWRRQDGRRRGDCGTRWYLPTRQLLVREPAVAAASSNASAGSCNSRPLQQQPRALRARRPRDAIGSALSKDCQDRRQW